MTEGRHLCTFFYRSRNQQGTNGNMESQTTDAIMTSPNALAQLGAMAIHYGLSLAGAIVLLVGGWILSGFVSRWAYSGLSRIHGIDETLARFFEKVLHYGLLILVFVMVLGQYGVDRCRSWRRRPCYWPGIAGDASKYRRGHHASRAQTLSSWRIYRDVERQGQDR